MKILLSAFFLFAFIPPSKAVTTKMFKVLDTCARYRLGEIDAKPVSYTHLTLPTIYSV